MKKRFQKTIFKKQLSQARSFSRRPQLRQIKHSRFSLLTSKMFWLGVCVLGLAITSIYVPNFLYVYSLHIDAPDKHMVAKADKVSQSYLESYENGLWPRRSVLFFKKEELASYMKSVLPEVLDVTIAKNGIATSLKLGLSLRLETFVYDTGENTVLLSQDGRPMDKVSTNVSGESLLKLSVYKPEARGSRQQGLFPAETASAIYVKQEFARQTGLHGLSSIVFLPVTITKSEEQVDETEAQVLGASTQVLPSSVVEVVDKPSIEMRLEVKFTDTAGSAGTVGVLLPVKSDLSQEFAGLKALVESKGKDKLQAQAYVDLRYEDKAFLCERNAQCAEDQPGLAPKVAPESLPVTVE